MFEFIKCLHFFINVFELYDFVIKLLSNLKESIESFYGHCCCFS